jgi:hypothetical protein
MHVLKRKKVLASLGAKSAKSAGFRTFYVRKRIIGLLRIFAKQGRGWAGLKPRVTSYAHVSSSKLPAEFATGYRGQARAASSPSRNLIARVTSPAL